jgi:molecular chaperone GrpE
MEKKENFQDKSNNTNDEINPDNQKNLNQDTIEDTENANNEKVEISPEEKVKELEDKLVRAFAEMENQRRRFEKEKDDAFNYGGFNFAKESLNLLDNLERSRVSLENDEKLKNTEILKKTIEHLNII